MPERAAVPKAKAGVFSARGTGELKEGKLNKKQRKRNQQAEAHDAAEEQGTATAATAAGSGSAVNGHQPNARPASADSVHTSRFRRASQWLGSLHRARTSVEDVGAPAVAAEGFSAAAPSAAHPSEKVAAMPQAHTLPPALLNSETLSRGQRSGRTSQQMVQQPGPPEGLDADGSPRRSPRGSVGGGGSGSEQMQIWAQLEGAEESDFVGNHRKSSNLKAHAAIAVELRAPPSQIVSSKSLDELRSEVELRRSAGQKPAQARRMSVVEREAAAWQKENERWIDLIAGSKVPASYKGAALLDPPTAACMEKLVAAFTLDENRPLHRRYLLQIMLACKKQWTQRQPPGYAGQTAASVVDLPEPGPGTRLIIVGDTHGQLQDVLWIFAEYGLPSPTNRYLFNGDVADRGDYAVEIFALLLGYMLVYPGSVFLNRGNHENEEINERQKKYGGGFAEEVRAKYDGDVFELFVELYERMPIGFVIGGKTLVVHGGLSRHRGVCMSHLRRLSPKQQCPEAPQSFEDYLFFDLMWSDPHPDDADGVHESARGDGCILFGMDMTLDFLESNSLQLLVRSHQVPSDGHGYEVLHGGRCITIFSASNYGGTCCNTGAVLVWAGEEEVCAHEFTAPTFDELRAARGKDGMPRKAGIDRLLAKHSSRGTQWAESVGVAAAAPQVARMDGDIVRMLKERICRHKHELQAYFDGATAAGGERVGVAEWAKGMSAVLHLDIPWAKYQPWLTRLEDDGRIDYAAFLQRFQIRLKGPYGSWQRSVLRTLYNSLLAADLQMDELLSYFDKDGDGMVSPAEAREALAKAELGLSAAQIAQVVRSLGLGRDGGGSIPTEDFLGKLMVASEATSVVARSEREKYDLAQITKLLRGLQKKKGKALGQVFSEWDEDGNGYVDYEEFSACCLAYQAECSADELAYEYAHEDFLEIAEALDLSKQGRINYLSFAALLKLDECAQAQAASSAGSRGQLGWADSTLVQHICTTLWSNDVLVHKAFRCFDTENTGALRPDDFRAALATANAELARPHTPLTRQQIDQLVEALPLDESERINYTEFMGAFEAVDTSHYERTSA